MSSNSGFHSGAQIWNWDMLLLIYQLLSIHRIYRSFVFQSFSRTLLFGSLVFDRCNTTKIKERFKFCFRRKIARTFDANWKRCNIIIVSFEELVDFQRKRILFENRRAMSKTRICTNLCKYYQMIYKLLSYLSKSFVQILFIFI